MLHHANHYLESIELTITIYWRSSCDTNVIVLVVTLLNEYIEHVVLKDIHQKNLNQVPLSKLDKYRVSALIKLFALIGK